MTTVKICGLKDPDTVRAVRQLPIDHVGFLFAPSKRQVTPETAGRLLVELRADAGVTGRAPLAFGVFVNPSMEQLEDVMRQAPLDVIQLHGDESPAFCSQVKQRFGVPVYRSVSVNEVNGAVDGDATGAGALPGNEAGAAAATEAAVSARLDAYSGCIDGLLLDTAGGGTGRTFEWNRIPAYAAWTQRQGIPLLVAGGLSPDNVAGLVEAYRPDGVDVSSGVETGGVKDIGKITAFVERVKRHESHTTA